MEWSDLGKGLASIAPILGGAVGGPGGAAIGNLLASAFGGSGDDPAELDALIKVDPQAAVKLKEIEYNHKTELEKLIVAGESNRLAADTSRIESVNATMRTEAIAGDAWTRRWRPFFGYVTGVTFFLQMLVIFYAIIFKTTAAVTIITALASLQVFWSVPLAVLGISAYQRGKEKRAALGENIQPLLSLFNRK